MERNFPIIYWTRKFWKIRALDYNQHIILIMYTNARSQSVGTTSGFGTKFPPKNMTDKNFEKINIKIVINIMQCILVPNFN